MNENDDVMLALAAHDLAVKRLGRPIWIGAEPTYTDRSSEAPEWLFEALGDDKLHRAKKMLANLARNEPGAAVLRCVGRQYGGEPLPRWSFGLYSRRDGTPLWLGPPDPLLARPATVPPAETLAVALTRTLRSMGYNAAIVDGLTSARVVFRTDGKSPPAHRDIEPLLGRPSLHGQRVEGAEVVDTLIDDGNYLVVFDECDGALCAELPGIRHVPLFERLLAALSNAASAAQTPSLILSGFPPPVDETVTWMTLTPDPAVIEANMAPVATASDLLLHLRRLEQAATEQGLASYRLQYNGMESDSGGGGHVTFGGARPSGSPFLNLPSLLPSLVRYFNRHPSLSYLHAVESVGPASQAPRADETLRQTLPELSLALELMKRANDLSPETLWGTLAPFLSDPSGNSHRAEINIEKLWNESLGSRGKLGLVEFRAFRMAPSPETTAALATLLRAVVAMLAEHPCDEPLIDWGQTLHQRFSLPYFLHVDLKTVLADLQRAGLGLGAALIPHVLRDRDLVLANRDIGTLLVQIRRAREFWPLIGDVATQERGGSRLIDASTSRIELRLRPARPTESLDDWTVSVGNWSIPLHDAMDEEGSLRIVGMRYRSFVPAFGLHPTLGAQVPLSLKLSHPQQGVWQITLHEWHPAGEPYPGLPANFAEARSRREARCVVRQLGTHPMQLVSPPDEAVGEHVVDLRWQ